MGIINVAGSGPAVLSGAGWFGGSEACAAVAILIYSLLLRGRASVSVASLALSQQNGGAWTEPACRVPAWPRDDI